MGIKLIDLLLVALGGIIGSVLRWQIIESIATLSIAVFIVNQLGVLVAGFVAYRMDATELQKRFWITGFAGGFTTLSSFAFILHDSPPISGMIQAAESLLISVVILKIMKAKAKR
jgi:CrcB protein